MINIDKQQQPNFEIPSKISVQNSAKKNTITNYFGQNNTETDVTEIRSTPITQSQNNGGMFGLTNNKNFGQNIIMNSGDNQMGTSQFMGQFQQPSQQSFFNMQTPEAKPKHSNNNPSFFQNSSGQQNFMGVSNGQQTGNTPSFFVQNQQQQQFSGGDNLANNNNQTSFFSFANNFRNANTTNNNDQYTNNNNQMSSEDDYDMNGRDNSQSYQQSQSDYSEDLSNAELLDEINTLQQVNTNFDINQFGRGHRVSHSAFYNPTNQQNSFFR